MCAYARVRARSWLCIDFVVLPLLLAFEPVSVPPTLCPSVLRGCNFVCVCAHGCKGRANRTCQRQKSAQPQCPPPRSVPAVDTTIASRRPNQEPITLYPTQWPGPITRALAAPRSAGPLFPEDTHAAKYRALAPPQPAKGCAYGRTHARVSACAAVAGERRPHQCLP